MPGADRAALHCSVTHNIDDTNGYNFLTTIRLDTDDMTKQLSSPILHNTNVPGPVMVWLLPR